MKVTELGESPVIRTMSARDSDGFCRMAFRIRRSFAWRNADLLRAPRVVKTTAGIDVHRVERAKSIISVIELSVNLIAARAPF